MTLRAPPAQFPSGEAGRGFVDDGDAGQCFCFVLIGGEKRGLFEQLRGKGAAGAGSRITGTPASVANCAARQTLSSGISSCNITMSAPAIRSAALSTSAGVRAALAPDATEIKFSPAVSTRISATPVWLAGSRETRSMLIPSRR